jgi:Asp-tRNA(Asn)/Glu-tRNA(Gln) amidotransferase A subunit family amidase
MQLRADLAGGRVSATEVVRDTLQRIAAADDLNAFLNVCSEAALAAAGAADEALAGGRSTGPLHGIPVAVKDLQETAGTATSYGVAALRDHVPDADAVIVARLRRAGAIVVGKTNTPAFGALGETRNRMGGDCRNPRDRSRTAGGSSGGSAAAVAAGLVPLATGTDSAGSIACPASFCGTVGMKPTRGRVPHWPAPEDSLLLDHTGPLAGSVADVALALSVVAGPDARDPRSVRCPPAPPPPRTPDADRPLAGLRVAHSSDLGHFAVDPGVAEAVQRAAGILGELGAEVEEAHPAMEDPRAVYLPLYATDFRRSLAAGGDEVLAELYPETHDELAAHPSMSAEAYVGILHRWWRLAAAVTEFFGRFDLLVTPATGCVAFPLREPPARIGGRDVVAGWPGFMPFQVPWNLTGHPTVTVPCGTSDGMPVGLLMAGPFGGDAGVLQAAHAFETAAA